MSNKKYDDDDIQRLGEVIAEQLVSEFKTGLEALTSIKQAVARIPKLEADLGALKSDMNTVKAAVKATNEDVKKLDKTVKINSKDIRSLDKAVGKTEHQVNMSLKFSELAYHEARKSRKSELQQLENHEARLLRLETA